MAYGTTAAGTITKEQTLLSTKRYPVAASTLITKGQVCVIDSSGNLVTAPTSATAGKQHFVSLETVDNSAGSAGDLSCPVAVRGHFVTVVADGTILPGQPVKTSTSTAGRVLAFAVGTDAEGLKVGYYTGKEGGSVNKSISTSPYLETFTDGENFLTASAAQGNVIEIELR